MTKPPFLKGSSCVGPAARAFRKDQKGVARADRLGRSFDRRKRRIAIVALAPRTNPPISIALPSTGNLLQLRLVENVQAPVQRAKQHRRIDVALMVGAEHHRAIARECARGR